MHKKVQDKSIQRQNKPRSVHTNLDRVLLPCGRYASFKRAQIYSSENYPSKDWYARSLLSTGASSVSSLLLFLLSKKPLSFTWFTFLKTLIFVLSMLRESLLCPKTCNLLEEFAAKGRE